MPPQSSDIVELKKKMDSLDDSAKAQSAEVKADVAVLKHKMEDLQGSTKAQSDEVKADVAELTKEMKNLKDENTHLRTELAAFKGRVEIVLSILKFVAVTATGLLGIVIYSIYGAAKVEERVNQIDARTKATEERVNQIDARTIGMEKALSGFINKSKQDSKAP